MTKTLPKTDSGTEFIQFRGYQTSVTLDDFGVRFRTGRRETPEDSDDVLAHEPLPVVDPADINDPDTETPRNAVAREVAEALTGGDLANPLVCWGVVCEWPETDEDGDPTDAVCGETFDSPRALNGHLRVHYDDEVDEQDVADDPEAAADEEGDTEFEDRTGTPAGGAATADVEVAGDTDTDTGTDTDEDTDEGDDDDALGSGVIEPTSSGVDASEPAESADTPPETDDSTEDE